MTGHGYESGRLNLPFVGISTFGKRPYVEGWSSIDAHAAILGAPFDFGTQFRPGARFGPRAVREASTLFSFGHAGAYDHEDDRTYLGPSVRIVDIGDADIVHTDTERSHANIETGVRAILKAGALPVVIGGDHSVNIPCIRAFDGEGPIHILQIDAHLDFVDERHGVRHGHGNPMRRAAERPHVTGLTQLGIRNVSSTAREGYDAARAMGADILSVRQVRKLGVAGVLAVWLTRAASKRRLSLLRGAGDPARRGAGARHRRDRPCRGGARLRPDRLDRHPCGAGSPEPPRLRLRRARTLAAATGTAAAPLRRAAPPAPRCRS